MTRRRRIVLGLNSGTSADGVDAAACEIVGRGRWVRVRVLGHVHRSYPAGLRQRLLRTMAPAHISTEEICSLHGEVGRAFAQTAIAVVRKLGLQRVDLVGAHGQTICHQPPRRRTGRRRPGTTMQIGDGSVIATRLRAPVVTQFRLADMAVGGQGAPLVPWTDHILFQHPRRNRVIQNIGGIANLTWLPAAGGVEDVVAFDTGPGNMVIDALVRRFTHGRESFDRGGRRAARGTPDQRVLKDLMNHPFLAVSPPKSGGREDFGETWLQSVMKRHAHRRIGGDDWIATATAFTAASLVLAYAAFLPQPDEPRAWARAASRKQKAKIAKKGHPLKNEIILCGGGAKNPAIVGSLISYLAVDSRFAGAEIRTTADYGIDPQAKECVSFAMLAVACVDRVPANLPQVTGASRRVVLGQICNPEPGS